MQIGYGFPIRFLICRWIRDDQKFLRTFLNITPIFLRRISFVYKILIIENNNKTTTKSRKVMPNEFSKPKKLEICK